MIKVRLDEQLIYLVHLVLHMILNYLQLKEVNIEMADFLQLQIID